MDPVLTGLIGLGAMFALIALQVPVGIAMGTVGVVGCAFMIGWGPALSLVGTEPSSAISSTGLAVIAMFLLMGSLAHTGGLSGELYRLAYAFVGHRRGGLAMATIGACAGFGAVCGSSVATAATMANVALPEMISRKYSKELAAGTIAAGGTLGMIIPPSVLMILYGILTENSIIALFLAGVVPGLIAVVGYVGAVAVYTRLFPDAAPIGPRVSWKERRRTLADSWAVILLAAIVSGGIYSGIFTVTETASVGAVFAFGISLLRRRLTRSSILKCFGETATNTGLIFVILIGASVFSYFATLSGLPGALITGIQSLNLPPYLVILLLRANVPHPRLDLRHRRGHGADIAVRLSAGHRDGLRPNMVGRDQHCRNGNRHDHAADWDQRVRIARRRRGPTPERHLQGNYPLPHLRHPAFAAVDFRASTQHLAAPRGRLDVVTWTRPGARPAEPPSPRPQSTAAVCRDSASRL